MTPLRRIRRSTCGAVVLLLAVLAACTPPTNSPMVPSSFPPCVGSPTCVVGQDVAGLALSDDGRIMATMQLRTIEPGVRFEKTLGLVGIDDRWYRQVVKLDGDHVSPGVVMTPDAATLVYSRTTWSGTPDGADGLQVYRRSTGSTVRVPGTEVGSWGPEGISDDGRVLIAAETTELGPQQGLWKFDLVAGTSQRLTTSFRFSALSGDGRYLVTSQGVRMDLTDGSEVVLPPGIASHVSISGDGSRIASAGDTGEGPAEGFRYLDLGDPSWTVVSTAPTVAGAYLTRDGRRLIGSQIVGGPLPAEGVVDWDLDSGTMAVIAPVSRMDAMSPNGAHVLYRASGSTTLLRWNR